MSYSPSSNSKNIVWKSWGMGSDRDQYIQFTRVDWRAVKIPQNKLKHVLRQKYIFKIWGGEEGKTQAYRGHVKRGGDCTKFNKLRSSSGSEKKKILEVTQVKLETECYFSTKLSRTGVSLEGKVRRKDRNFPHVHQSFLRFNRKTR